MKIQSEKDLEIISNEYRQNIYHPEVIKVNIGMASCGIAAGAQDAFDNATENYSDNKDVQISQSGCIGFCEMEPLVEIFQNGKPRVMYKNITEKKIVDAIEDYREGISQKNWILGQIRDPRSLLEDDIKNPQAKVTPYENAPFLEDIPFYKNQVKIALRNCGYIDPDSIEEYIAK
ncbi:MAG: NADH-quinone oxidoreductase subunit F, partial [Deltaproteobacteria bacterium]|nr:NADH-quinone oxidoreductase subunit F [Deltaproteobacteria bacterium]